MRKYFYLIAVMVLLVDRLAKWAVASNIALHDSVTVIPGFFHITHVQNTGAAFGLFAESTAQWKVGALVSFSIIALIARAARLRRRADRGEKCSAFRCGQRIDPAFERQQSGEKAVQPAALLR